MAFAFVVGYGRGQIEPGIASLVRAVSDAGFETFSSCEGHANSDANFQRFPSVSFYADETQARAVQVALVRIRDQLRCSWGMSATFVLHRDTNGWVLGWALENNGFISEASTREEFERLSVEVGRDHDLPLLIDMFLAIGAIG